MRHDRRNSPPHVAPGPAAPATPAEGSFTCVHCQQKVSAVSLGTKQRNHCPHCLWSVHVDNVPGDRAANCGQPMEPVAIWARDQGEWALIHRCRACGALHSNRVAGDDNELALVSIAVRPLATPPFPLDQLSRMKG